MTTAALHLFVATLTPSETALTVALVGLVAGVIGAAATATLGRLAQAANERRREYSDAVKNLYAWSEYPYRVRRRTSDDPDELARLAGLGHDLQERLRWHETWVASESGWVSSHYRRAMLYISEHIGPAVADAWNHPPSESASGMVLGQWGVRVDRSLIIDLQAAISWRFGWRRLASSLGLHPSRPDSK